MGALAVSVGPGSALGTGVRVGIPGEYYPPTARGGPEEHRERSDRTPQCGVCGGRAGGNACYGDGGGTAPRTTLRARSGTLQVPSLS